MSKKIYHADEHTKNTRELIALMCQLHKLNGEEATLLVSVSNLWEGTKFRDFDLYRKYNARKTSEFMIAHSGIITEHAPTAESLKYRQVFQDMVMLFATPYEGQALELPDKVITDIQRLAFYIGREVMPVEDLFIVDEDVPEDQVDNYLAKLKTSPRDAQIAAVDTSMYLDEEDQGLTNRVILNAYHKSEELRDFIGIIMRICQEEHGTRRKRRGGADDELYGVDITPHKASSERMFAVKNTHFNCADRECRLIIEPDALHAPDTKHIVVTYDGEHLTKLRKMKAPYKPIALTSDEFRETALDVVKRLDVVINASGKSPLKEELIRLRNEIDKAAKKIKVVNAHEAASDDYLQSVLEGKGRGGIFQK